MEIIDTHAHLDQIDNIENCLKESSTVGVIGIVAVGVDMGSNVKNLAIKKVSSAPEIYLGFGIHPGNIVLDQIEETVQFIRENITQAAAIGEIGLDYWYKWVKKDNEKKQEQRDVYCRFLGLAKEFELPAIIHSRGAWGDCLTIAKDIGIKMAVFHWYSGPIDILEKILEMGYYVSATPSLAYSQQAQDAIKGAPLDQILIETDSPVYYHDKDNQNGFSSRPKDVINTLEILSSLKGVDKNKALPILNNNARKVFNIITP